MNLEGQERGAERGYAMAALLVSLAITAVLLTAAMPVWVTAARREREAELVWRGGQYARAVSLFRRKYANASPPSLDILINERFLRKKYKDPMTKDGEFQLVLATDQSQRPGEIAGANPQQGRAAPPRQTPSSPLDPQGRTSAGPRGGIIGVVSKSTERSIRMFNGRTKYNEWQFTPETLGIRVPGGAGNAPGGNVPGGAPGAIGPGGRRGPATPGRSPLGIDGFGRPSPSQPGQPGQPGQPPPQRPFGLPPQRPPG